MKHKLFYGDKTVHKLRDVRLGGKQWAEITILVPRNEVTEHMTLEVGSSKIEILDKSINIQGDKVEIVDSLVIEDASYKIDYQDGLELGKREGIWAYKKDEEVYLGIDIDNIKAKCKELKLNPIQVEQALDGSIKTHKGYTFETISK